MWRSLLRLQCSRVADSVWEAQIPVILASIRKAEFVSVDLELSGLHVRNERFVGVERCYEAHSDGAKQFVPLQLGICAARRSEHSPTHWILTPSSIYIYPPEDRIFQASSGTLSFLRENKFDFNRWISCGIGYIKPKEEEERRQSIQSQIEEIQKLKGLSSSNRKGSSVTGSAESPYAALLTDEDNRVVEQIRQTIDKWLEKNEERELEIPMANAFQRLLLHGIISREYSRIYSMSTRRHNERFLTIFRSEGQLYDQQLNDLQMELQKLVDSIGARKILDEIKKESKILVGHNCFYDMLHLYQTFYDTLPSSVSVFKEKWTEKFPMTFDTKYMAESHEFLSSLQPPATLKGLCEFMVSSHAHHTPSITFEVHSIPGVSWSLPEFISQHSSLFHASAETVPSPQNNRRCLDLDAVKDDAYPAHHLVAAEGFKKSLDATLLEDSSHEAGFDSMMTSIVFILQCSFILRMKKLKWDGIHFNTSQVANHSTSVSFKSMLDLLPLMVNHIRLVRTQPNVINLSGKEEVEMRRHFYMCDFPSNWKKWEIMKVWAPLWVNVCTIDEKSCWIIARTEDDGRNIQRIYDSMKSPKQFKLHSYDKYQEIIKSCGTS